MATTNWVGQTNHRLYLCRLLLDQHDVAEQPLRQALHEAALQQLQAAYRSYLNELAELVNVRQRVDSLDALESATDLVIGDMVEIRQLIRQPASWLARLLLACDNLGWPFDRPAVQALQTSSANLIASVGSDQDNTDDTWQWLASLNDLIERQRGNHRES